MCQLKSAHLKKNWCNKVVEFGSDWEILVSILTREEEETLKISIPIIYIFTHISLVEFYKFYKWKYPQRKIQDSRVTNFQFLKLCHSQKDILARHAIEKFVFQETESNQLNRDFTCSKKIIHTGRKFCTFGRIWVNSRRRSTYFRPLGEISGRHLNKYTIKEC